jgi:hypothetical protein
VLAQPDVDFAARRSAPPPAPRQRRAVVHHPPAHFLRAASPANAPAGRSPRSP